MCVCVWGGGGIKVLARHTGTFLLDMVTLMFTILSKELGIAKQSYIILLYPNYDHTEHAEQASSRGVLGGSNRLPGLVTKQQAVEFPQVQASVYNIIKSTLYFKNNNWACMLHFQDQWRG